MKERIKIIMKKLLIRLRKSVKLISLIGVALIMIGVAIAYIFKPTYSVSLNGEFIGYTKDKSNLQDKINEYIEKGDGGQTAFVQIDNLPEYTLCLLNRDVQTNDEEIYSTVKETGTPYYRYYAIAENGEEKMYVATFEEADNAVKQLKEKNSTNKDNITIVEKYQTDIKDLVSTEQVISVLYKEPVKEEPKKVSTPKNTTRIASSGVNTSGKKVNLGISLIKPVSGTITSRFGQRWGRSHTGLDVGAPTGTKIKAAAGGTVTKSGYSGNYGYVVVISHGNGVETYYAHCSALYAKVGQKVSQGEVIAAVGSTGRSTGPHLHLEIRVNGVAQNPLNYVY